MAHNTIDGNPTKKFFIEMITRDISIDLNARADLVQKPLIAMNSL